MKQLRLIFPIVCLIGLAILFFNRPASSKSQVTKKAGSVQETEEVEASLPIDEKMHIYLLMGEAETATNLTDPKNAELIERCVQLNDKKEWVPVVDAKLPEHDFVRKMLEKQKTLKIGLVNCTRENTKIDDWIDRKSPENRQMRQFVKDAMPHGTVKGVLWFQGGNDAAEGLSDKLKSFVSELRSHVQEPNLPFVFGQVQDSPAIQAELAKFAENVHVSAIASSEGLKTVDGLRDEKSQALLGQRYAVHMKALRVGYDKVTPKAPTDMKFIDPHVHAMSVTPLGLRAVATWMDERNVERCIVSPLNHKGSRPQTEEEYQILLENFRPYKGKIDRMCIIRAGEVKSAD